MKKKVAELPRLPNSLAQRRRASLSQAAGSRSPQCRQRAASPALSFPHAGQIRDRVIVALLIPGLAI